MKKKIGIILFSLNFILLSVHSQQEIVNLNKDWRFCVQNPIGASHPDFNDSQWRKLDLPHDYSAEGAYDRVNSPQNAWLPITDCWYRKLVRYDDSWKGKLLYLWFDGAYMDCEVYVNGELAGNRPYGFISFYFDVTNLMKAGKNNVVCVRLKNQPAPTSRFYHGTALYGNTKLFAVSPIHIPISGGVFYKVKSCSPQEAILEINTEIINRSPRNGKTTLRHTIYKSNGEKVCSEDLTSASIPSLMTDTLKTCLRIATPSLWDIESPHLYRLHSELFLDGTLIDAVDTQVGIRTIEYRVDTGFYLNGKNIKLQGVCEHMEMLPVGQAIPTDLWRKRILLLKEMGCNAIRTAHNPFVPVFYELCDELGMMVVDEIFDGWKRKDANDYGDRFFADWWRKDVTDWVRRDRNHPCIVMWSIGNETGGTDIHHITDLIHQHDAHTRPTSGGNVHFGTDISGFTGQGGMPGALEKFHKDYPGRAIVLTEVPHTIQTRGFYRVPTWWRDKGGAVNEYKPYGTKQIFFDGTPRYQSSYDNSSVRINARTCWKRTKNTPWIIGEFRWTGYDCVGEAQFMGIEFPKRSYNSGVIDFAGFPKDHYYFYQSQWTIRPMVHLLPHWTHMNMKLGTEIPIVAYSNCEEVELFLNGKSLGRKRSGELLDFVWNVPYTSGEIKAIAYRKGVKCAETSHRTASEPVRLKLSITQPYKIQADNTVTYLDVSTTDKKGNFIPWTCNEVVFWIDGNTTVLGFENGNPVDGTRNKDLKRTLFYGLSRGFFQNTTDEEPVSVMAASILGDTLFSKSTQIAIDVASCALRGEKAKLHPTIYYTLDGTEPNRHSLKYNKPFTLTESALIRAVVYLNGIEQVFLKEKFTKGGVLKFIDPMLQTDEVLKNKFTGPFDAELVGYWEVENTVYLFDKNGTLFAFASNNKHHPKRVAQWWYDYSDDQFENPDDVGTGEIKWDTNNQTVPLKLIQGTRDRIEFAQDGRIIELVRSSEQ